MPSCSACSMLKDGVCVAAHVAAETLKRPLCRPRPLAACVVAIVEQYARFIEKGHNVLDIGCGSWQWLRDHCFAVGAHYEGLDVAQEYFGVKTAATRIENLADLSFPDDEFDVVIGNQTMEHWPENGCSLEWGLYQCFRVCRPQGHVFMNVPIHFHGARPFLFGELGQLRELFSRFSGQVTFDSWANPSDPLPPFYPHPGYWPLRGKPAYILDIRATKDRALPSSPRNGCAANGKVGQVLHRPLSFNVYCAARRCGLFGRPLARAGVQRGSR